MGQDIDSSFGRETVSPEERQRRIRDLFDRVAKRYDLMNDMMSFGIHRLWKRSFVRGLPRQGLVVDLAEPACSQQFPHLVHFLKLLLVGGDEGRGLHHEFV